MPPNKQEILDEYEGRAEQINKRYQRGALSHQERNDEMVRIWGQATEEVARAMEANFPADNSISRIIASGAAGNMTQVRQLAGMKGLVANPKGEFIPRPIKSNFREGFSVVEYFISTHGTRKGLADTALRTADSGYLTRRLVDVSQDVIVREVDCGTERGFPMTIAVEGADGSSLAGSLVRDVHVDTGVYTRCAASAVTDADGSVLLEAGSDVGQQAIDFLIANGVSKVRVRSVLTCDSAQGVCAMCYGRSLATGKLVDVGEAVGIVAAQSIGEPGTQLTMRTFQQGGVAGEDITTGLPRVQELFEARVPKGKAPIADVDGRVQLEDGDKFWKITLIPDDGSEEVVYEKLSKRQRLATIPVDGSERPLADGDHVAVGQQLLEGTADPHESAARDGPARGAAAPRRRGPEGVPLAGACRSTTSTSRSSSGRCCARVTIIDSGATEFLPGGVVDRAEFESQNRRVVSEGSDPAAGAPGAHGDHQGVAGHRVVAVGGVLPGDDAHPHQRRDRGEERPPRRAEGERHHREADPGRHRDQPVPQHRGPADRGGPRGRLRPPELRRRVLLVGHVRRGPPVPPWPLDDYDFGQYR